MILREERERVEGIYEETCTISLVDLEFVSSSLPSAPHMSVSHDSHVRVM